jgi:hypothetical protein
MSEGARRSARFQGNHQPSASPSRRRSSGLKRRDVREERCQVADSVADGPHDNQREARLVKTHWPMPVANVRVVEVPGIRMKHCNMTSWKLDRNSSPSSFDTEPGKDIPSGDPPQHTANGVPRQSRRRNTERYSSSSTASVSFFSRHPYHSLVFLLAT